jgi:hypothetical protein
MSRLARTEQPIRRPFTPEELPSEELPAVLG